MEITEVLLILGIFLPLFFVGVWQLNRINPTKKGAKAADSSLKELYKVHSDQVADILKLKDKAISSLQAKIRNYEQDEEEEDEEDSIGIPQIKEILQKQGINPAFLDIPFVQHKIKELTKGMSVKDALNLVNQFGKTKTSGQSEQDTEGKDPNVEYH